MSSFLGGSLKLKGGPSGIAKKKKKKTLKSEGKIAPAQGEAAVTETESSQHVSPDKADNVDKRTAAEKRHDEWLAKHQRDTLKKAAAKSYRERIQEYNEHLSTLSEHHDIPKVGPG